jgi:hypothetical protein
MGRPVRTKRVQRRRLRREVKSRIQRQKAVARRAMRM